MSVCRLYSVGSALRNGKEASRAFAAYEIIAMSTILMTLSIYVHKYD